MAGRPLGRWALLILGLVLLIGSAGGAFFWHYWLGPWRNTVNERWLRRHSAEAIWEETQEKILRLGWGHDDGQVVGLYGGREWVAWLIEGMRPGESISDCRHGHKDESLRCMTNQYPGPSAEAWIDWWQANRHKTQTEWIRDGFAQGGLVLHSPLTRADVRKLLAAMGTKDKVPRGWRWNAFRLLREGGFRTDTMKPGDLSGEDGEVVLAGVLAYAEWSALHPPVDPAGLLRKGPPPEDDMAVTPRLAGRSATIALGALFAFLFAVGVFCVAFFVRLRRLGRAA